MWHTLPEYSLGKLYVNIQVDLTREPLISSTVRERCYFKWSIP